MKRLKLSVLGMMLGVVSAQALTLQEDKVLQVSAAKEALTRISVAGDKIQDVFVHPAQAQEHIKLHKSGHVFITPAGSPVYLSLITEKGKTQDIEVSFKGLKASPVILQAKAEKRPSYTAKDFVSLTKFFLQGGVPKGFTYAPFSPQTRKGKNLTVELESAFSNGPYRVLVFKGKNSNKTNLTLDPKTFGLFGDRSVTLSRHEVSPGEDVTLIIIQET